MKGYFQHFILMAEFSFVAALMLGVWDCFRWRKFKIWNREEENVSGQVPLRSSRRWWHIALTLLFAVPLFIVLLPVFVGATPALFVVAAVSRAGWNWRIIYRGLRRRRAVIPTFESFFVAPFVTFSRWRSRRSRQRQRTDSGL
jgi:hypothetical protein